MEIKTKDQDQIDPDGAIIKPMSWRMSRKIQQLNSMLNASALAVDHAEAVGDIEGIEEGWLKIEEIWDKIHDMIIPFIEHIPASWLTCDAPKDIDWTKGTALNYLTREREQYVNRVALGIEAMEDSKN